jgi:purine nucleosidase
MLNPIESYRNEKPPRVGVPLAPSLFRFSTCAFSCRSWLRRITPFLFLYLAVFLLLDGICHASAVSLQKPAPLPQPSDSVISGRVIPQKVIIDTDIGDDVDDAFAVGLALQSTELQVIGITTAWGDTQLRARLLDRLLKETGRSDIPVAVGIEKHGPGQGVFTQARWAQAGLPAKEHPAAVDFLLQQIQAQPGQITLVAIAPLTNVGAAIDRDAATFRKLRRVVIMGGSVYHGYDDYGEGTRPPDREYNIAMDVQAAQKLFAAGVPLSVMPLDSTQLKLDEVKRMLLFTASTPLTDALALLTLQWSRGTGRETPTLFDAMPVAFAIAPELCPAQPLRLRVDEQGYTRPEPGTPNAQVCIASDPTKFFDFFLPRLMK